MAKIVPHKNAFNEAEKYYKNLRILEKIAAGVSIGGTIISYISCFPSSCVKIFIVFSLLCTLGLFYYQRRFEETYRKAEDIRRDGLIDSTFGTKIADIQSEGYYDTTEVELGLRKLLANIHENSFFSSRILKPIFKSKEACNIIAFIVLVVVAAVSTYSTQIILAVLQLFLSTSFLADYYRVKDLRESTNEVQENCKRIWDELEQNYKKKMSISL